MTEQMDIAVDAMHKHKFKDAMKVLDAIIAGNPQDSTAILNKAFCFYHLKKFQHAMEWAQKATELEPNNITAYQLLASSYHQQLRYPEAMSAVEKALEMEPSSDYSLQIKTAILMSSQKFPENFADSKDSVRRGAEYLKFTQDLDKLILDARNSRATRVENQITSDESVDEEKQEQARRAISKGKFEEASVILNDLLRKNPSNLVAALNKSINLTFQKKYSEALPIILSVLKSNLDDVRVYSTLSITLFSQNKFSECEYVLKKGLAIEPNNWGLHFMLGSTLLRLKKKKAAYLERKIAYRLHPSFNTFMGVANSFQYILYPILIVGVYVLFALSVIFSSPAFLVPIGLWYLLGIEEMIRLRNWKSLIILLALGLVVALVVFAARSTR